MMQQLFGDYRKKMHEEEVARQKRLLNLCTLCFTFELFPSGHNQIHAATKTEIPLASRFVRRTHTTNDSLPINEQTFSFNFQIPNSDLDQNQ